MTALIIGEEIEQEKHATSSPKNALKPATGKSSFLRAHLENRATQAESKGIKKANMHSFISPNIIRKFSKSRALIQYENIGSSSPKTPSNPYQARLCFWSAP